MEKITSVSNEKIKFVNSLQHKNVRDKEKLFICEGLRLCEVVAESNFEIKSAYATRKMLEDHRVKKLINRLNSSICFEVSEQVFKKISETDNPQGILFVVKIPVTSSNLQTILTKKKSVIVCLDRVQDPGNVGTILRTCSAVDVDAVILLNGSADIFSGKVVRSSMGAIFKLSAIFKMSTDEFLQSTAGKNLFATAANAETIYFNADFSDSSIFVFGNEANGVDQKILNQSKTISIPMKNSVESLNVSISASVILFEVMRQREVQLS